MEVTGFDNVRLPIYQSFTHNGFYNNLAYGLHCEQTTYQRCNWGSRATVIAGSAGKEIIFAIKIYCQRRVLTNKLYAISVKT